MSIGEAEYPVETFAHGFLGKGLTRHKPLGLHAVVWDKPFGGSFVQHTVDMCAVVRGVTRI